jgi:CBS-domain-containing membrane protein
MPISLDRLASLKVADVMSRQVVSLSPQQTMAEAAALFVRHKISAPRSSTSKGGAWAC